MNRVAIVTSHLATGDAVSNDVVGMYRALAGRGLDARMYAGSWDFEEPRVFPIEELREFLTDATDLFLYHYSIGWGAGLYLLRELKCRKVVKYHNVTPPGFFVGVSPWHEEKCRVGLEELKEVARTACDLYLADSDYNRQDLLKEGVAPERCLVVPPFHHIDRLRAIEADLPLIDAFRDGRTNVLMVGRIAPHKGHADLIEAFAAYHHDYNRESRLFIVGKEEVPFQSYSARLREITAFLLSEGAVVFTGEASDQELKAYYLLASVFAIASQHEGFCVPVVEAMAMKLPVVAYSSSALPATMGDTGVLLTERRPYLMAEAIDRVTRSEEVGVALGMKGWRRYEENFTNERIEAELFRALGRLD